MTLQLVAGMSAFCILGCRDSARFCVTAHLANWSVASSGGHHEFVRHLLQAGDN